MPELPDVTVYVETLTELLAGQVLAGVRVASPFVLRTVSPAPAELVGRRLRGFRRIGKRIVFEFEGDLFAVLHLMIAGRLHWKKRGAALARGRGLVAFDFDHGSLLFTEVSKNKRASLHLVQGAAGLAGFDRGGLEVLAAGTAEFDRALRRENHTLKRALTDPRVLSGIGNAYSDEILHRARLSPFKRTGDLDSSQMSRLYQASRAVLGEWTERLRRAAGGRLPEKVTAFHAAMAVHGRYRQPCPACGSPVQRVVYAENEANYCARCQTDGRLLADRALSRLLKDDWPRTLAQLEAAARPEDGDGDGPDSD